MSSKHTILVIEDNPDNSKLVTWILEDEDYGVVCANTAEAGIELLTQHEFAAVLMDISLPGMDGKEATQYIRQLPDYKDIPIIALTAHAVKGEHDMILNCGVNDLITKPLDEVLLIERLAQLIH